MTRRALRWWTAACALASLAGCGTQAAPTAPAPLPPLHRAAMPGQGGGSLFATLRWPARRLLATSGAAAKAAADVQSVKLYLLEGETQAGLGSEWQVVAGSGFTYVLGDANRTEAHVDVVYTNVPANAPGRSYRLAAAGFDSGGNITNAAAPLTLGGEGRFCVSGGGGDADAPGTLRVAPNYAVATEPLAVTLKLLDAQPATLDAEVTIWDGGP
ncbi:MAG: hypothetical protein ACK46X_11560 [Candidatus Sericytochromatia bacterium]